MQQMICVITMSGNGILSFSAITLQIMLEVMRSSSLLVGEDPEWNGLKLLCVPLPPAYQLQYTNFQLCAYNTRFFMFSQCVELIVQWSPFSGS